MPDTFLDQRTGNESTKKTMQRQVLVSKIKSPQNNIKQDCECSTLPTPLPPWLLSTIPELDVVKNLTLTEGGWTWIRTPEGPRSSYITQNLVHISRLEEKCLQVCVSESSVGRKDILRRKNKEHCNKKHLLKWFW